MFRILCVRVTQPYIGNCINIQSRYSSCLGCSATTGFLPVILRRHFSATPINHFFVNKKVVQGSAYSKWTRRAFKIGIGIGFGALIIAYAVYQEKSKIKPVFKSVNFNDWYVLSESPPVVQPAKIVKSPSDLTELKITLYQYQTCPFCCKVRAFLDYYGFSYNAVEVNSVTRKETKWTKYRKVPFVIIEIGNSSKIYHLKDSSMIISSLYSVLCNKKVAFEEILNFYPVMVSDSKSGKEQIDIMNKYSLMYGENEPEDLNYESIMEERHWRTWVDEEYIHVLSPNIYRSLNESFQAFSWFSQAGRWDDIFSTWEKLLVLYVGPLAMYIIGKILKKRYHLKDDVRVSLYDESSVWVNAIKHKGTRFLGGDKPNLADLNVYGALSAIEGCDAFDDLLLNTGISSWFYAVKEAISQHRGSETLSQRGTVL